VGEFKKNVWSFQIISTVHKRLWGDPSASKMIIARRFSLTNFFIATTALGFQVFVLYPWHKQLDDDFKELREESLRVLKRRDEAHLAELLEIKELIRRSDAKSSRSWGSIFRG
jgi:hypothetical protein